MAGQNGLSIVIAPDDEDERRRLRSMSRIRERPISVPQAIAEGIPEPPDEDVSDDERRRRGLRALAAR